LSPRCTWGWPNGCTQFWWVRELTVDENIDESRELTVDENIDESENWLWMMTNHNYYNAFMQDLGKNYFILRHLITMYSSCLFDIIYNLQFTVVPPRPSVIENNACIFCRFYNFLHIYFTSHDLQCFVVELHLCLENNWWSSKKYYLYYV
jgi:hypothetical protein